MQSHDDQRLVNSSNFSYFCPKRFNRYPRFTIFFKKDKDNEKQDPENMVSLSPQFLSYLMDKGPENKDLSGLEKERPQNASIIEQASAAEGAVPSIPIKLTGHDMDSV